MGKSTTVDFTESRRLVWSGKRTGRRQPWSITL